MADDVLLVWNAVRVRCGAGLSRVAALVGGALLASVAVAAPNVTLSKFPPNPGVLPGGGWKMTQGTTFANPTPPRAWVNGVYGAVPAAVATDSLTLAGPAGPLAVSVAQKAALADIAVAAASVLPVVGNVVSGVNLLLNAYRVFNESDSGGPALAHDPGTAAVSVDGYCVSPSSSFSGNTGTCAASPQAVAAIDVASKNAATADNQINACLTRRIRWSVGACSVSGNTAFCQTFESITNVSARASECSSDPQYFQSDNLSMIKKTTVGCKGSVDALNPAYSVPDGAPQGYDGLCPTGRYNHKAISPAEIPNVVSIGSPPAADTVTAAAKDAIDKGATMPAEATSTGPVSQTGQAATTSTLNPDGSTLQSVDTPSYQFQYNGNTITYGTTHNVVTNTCTGANSCAQTTTTVSTPAPVVTTEPKSDPSGCELNPSAAGCGGAASSQPTLYTAKTATYAAALNAFKATLLSSSLGTAMGGYFAVTGGGVCPTFSAHIPYIGADVVIDAYCSQWATTALGLLKAAMLVVAGIAAFRVAAL